MTEDRQPGVAVVTGSAGGIGGATLRLLQKQSVRVIGIDLHGAEVIADLSTAQGRAAMVSQVSKLAPDGLDAVVACAGISAGTAARTIATNYFGGVATLQGLRPLLAKRAPSGGIAISSTSAIEELDERLIEACLSGDEAEALRIADASDPMEIYGSSKRAFALWVRRSAIQPDWAGSGIALNAIAPGLVRTGMTADLIDDPERMAFLDKVVPRAIGGPAEPWKLAEAIVAIANLRSGFLIGQTIFVDGGTTAIRVPDPFKTGIAPMP